MSVHTFEAMGTVVSIRLDTSSRETVAIAAAQQVFERLNETFSLYLPTSEISRIARGELLLTDSSERMREAYGQALHWREATNGAFTPHRPDGTLDLSGTIKAVAIAEAARAVEACGFPVFSINAGGDILTHGSPQGDDWTTGIVDPLNRDELLSVVTLTSDFPAMATSGSAERGDHIWARPGATKDFLQATVIAGDIVTADVLATAIISGGQPTLDFLTANFAIAVLAVTPDGELLANAPFQELVAR
jgi:thiamine biosynthesis lipoprotein